MPTRISYDGMSRLTSAGYLENGKRNNHFSTSYKYDLMGNILSLRRDGLLNSGNYGTIDDLTYSYEGNQVVNIDDAAGITSIDCSNLVYDNDNISTILFDGGYASVDKDGNIAMHYYVKDHLGSNRLVVDGNGNIEETNHYYPFGALMDDSKNTKKNKYKYVGKELDRMYGLDMQDHFLRFYNTSNIKWNKLDILSEKYYTFSPYAYSKNNPILYFDLRGDS